MKYVPLLIGLPAIVFFAHETSWQAAMCLYLVMAANNLDRNLSNEKDSTP